MAAMVVFNSFKMKPGVVENSLKTKLEKCSISMVVVAV